MNDWHHRGLRPDLPGVSYVRIALLLLLTALFPRAAVGGEQPEHYHMVYVLARIAGFNTSDAALVASASWSVDLNKDTTAWTGDAADYRAATAFLGHSLTETRNVTLAAERELFDAAGNLHHGPQGMVYHALASERSRRLLRDYWRSTIDQTIGTQRLITTGIYLHFLVDSYVHPTDPIEGHFKQGHEPDRAINRPREFAAAAQESLVVLRDLFEKTRGKDNGGRTASERLRALGLDTIEARQALSRNVVTAIASAYRKVTVANYRDPTSVVELTEVTQHLQHIVAPLMSGVGETFGIQPVKPLRYERAENGRLRIDGSDTSFSIEDGVSRIATTNSGPLRVARDELVQATVSRYIDRVTITAAKNQVVFDKNRGTADAEALANEAKQKLGFLTNTAGLVYDRAAGQGVRAFARAADGTVRVWAAAQNGLQFVEQRGGEAVKSSFVPLSRVVTEVSPSAPSPSVGGVHLAYAIDVLTALDAGAGLGVNQVSTIDGQFRLLSLKALVSRLRAVGWQLDRLDAEAKSLGGIGRIHGFLVVGKDANDLVLVGGMATQATALTAEDLVVGLRAVYRDGLEPAVSLDPDPAQLSGPQFSRVIGVPRDSRFARVMVDADYQMKRILLGLAPVNVSGFESHYELIKQATDLKDVLNRFWLTPAQLGVHELHASPSFSEMLFTGRIQVLTEAMHAAQAGMSGLGHSEPLAERAAASFTRHYAAIKAQYPIFSALEGLNDVVLMATLLKRIGITPRLLDDLTGDNVKYTGTQVPKAFPGLTNPVRDFGDRVFVLTGGVRLKNRASHNRASAYQDGQLRALRQLASQLSPSGRLVADAGFSSLIIAAPGGKRDRAEAAVESGLRKLGEGHPDEAVVQFDLAVAEDELMAEAYVYRAIARAARNQYRAAMRDVQRARQLEPDDDDVEALEVVMGSDSGRLIIQPSTLRPTVRSRVASVLLRRGFIRQLTHDNRAAIHQYTVALSIDSSLRDAYLYRGISETNQNDYVGAFRDFAAAIQLDPTAGDAYAHRSRAKTMTLDYEGAVEDATRAIAINGSDPLGYFNRGMAYARLKKFDAALADFTRVTALAPNIAETYSNRGLVKVIRKDFVGGLEDLSRAIDLDPTDPETYELRGMVRVERRLFDDATTDAERVLRLDTRRGAAYAIRGLAQLGRPTPDLQAVRRDLQQAVVLRPELRPDLERQARGLRPDLWPAIEPALGD